MTLSRTSVYIRVKIVERWEVRDHWTNNTKVRNTYFILFKSRVLFCTIWQSLRISFHCLYDEIRKRKTWMWGMHDYSSKRAASAKRRHVVRTLTDSTALVIAVSYLQSSEKSSVRTGSLASQAFLKNALNAMSSSCQDENTDFSNERERTMHVETIFVPGLFSIETKVFPTIRSYSVCMIIRCEYRMMLAFWLETRML